MADNCVAMWESSPSQDKLPILTATTEKFIGFLSTINICVITETFLDDVANGNSRNGAERFLFRCKNGQYCERTFISSLRRDQHSVNCNSPLADDTTMTSDVSFTKAKRQKKKTDISVAGEGFPKPCSESKDCGVTKDFATQHLMTNHRALHHDQKWPKNTPCNFPGCHLPRDTYFVSREAFRRHLAATHMLKAEKARIYVGKIIPVAYGAPHGVAKSYIITMRLVRRELIMLTTLTTLGI
jgi:hypothetical protein